MRTDNGSIVIGWLSRLVVLFAFLGVLAYDGVNVAVANFGAADDASVAARAAADSYVLKRDVQAAYDAAVKSLDDKPGDVVETDTFKVGADGSVELVVVRSPSTLWMKRIGPLKGMAEVRQDGHASPSS